MSLEDHVDSINSRRKSFSLRVMTRTVRVTVKVVFSSMISEVGNIIFSNEYLNQVCGSCLWSTHEENKK